MVDEQKNEFTWWFSHCAGDLVIDPYTSKKGVVVSDIVMSLSIRFGQSLYGYKANLIWSWSLPWLFLNILQGMCKK
jgi:hypothetical protein